MLRIKVFILVLLILGTLSAGVYFVYQLNRPVGEGEKKEIIVESGDSVWEIASKLHEEGLIRSTTTFVLYIRLRNLTAKLQAGRYDIPTSLSVAQITKLLQHGTFDVRLTFLEGWRREEYLEYMLERLPVDNESFTEGFMTETKELEGYLFPDTYLVSQDVTAKELVALLRENFERKYVEMAEVIAEQKLTKKQAVILASMVERETRQPEEAVIIAGIFLKRLKIGMPLGVCATVQYALGYQEKEETWWKKTISNEDTKADSLYNTYEHVGLPLAPICNPGLAALRAVANPQSSEYLYYLHDKDGNIHYAKTLEEHQQNKTKYLE